MEESDPGAHPAAAFYVSTNGPEGSSIDDDVKDNGTIGGKRNRAKSISSTLSLRKSISDAIQIVSSEGAIMDRAMGADRWTVNAVHALRQLLGALLLGTCKEYFPTALPTPGVGVPNAIESAGLLIIDRMEEVKSEILAGPRTTVTPLSELIDLLKSRTVLSAVVSGKEAATQLGQWKAGRGASANARALDLLVRNPGLAHATSNEWADQLGISAGRVRQLSVWKKLRDRQKRPTHAHSRPEDCAENELNRLTREQEVDRAFEDQGRVYGARI
jgi:hypothetical protein